MAILKTNRNWNYLSRLQFLLEDIEMKCALAVDSIYGDAAKTRELC